MIALVSLVMISVLVMRVQLGYGLLSGVFAGCIQAGLILFLDYAYLKLAVWLTDLELQVRWCCLQCYHICLLNVCLCRFGSENRDAIRG